MTTGDPIRPEIRALSAYTVAQSAGLLKLDAMENPYRWPDALITEWLAWLADEPVNRYPEPGPASLVAAVRTLGGVPEGVGLVFGNGSDELIQTIALSLKPELPILAPEPTFVMYRASATVAGHRYVGVPLGPDFALDRQAMRRAIETHHPGAIFLAYPNNPTGNLFADEDILALLEESEALVVVDEAYHPFAQRTFMDRLGRSPRLLVMRTLSKEGLAGLRFGFLAGDNSLTAQFEKVRLPYNINRLTQRTVEFVARHRDVFAAQAHTLCAERARLYGALAALPGVRVWPSEANFLLFAVPEAEAVFVALKARGVLIKSLAASGLPGHLRVTVGLPDENERFLAELGGVLAQGG